MLTFHAKQELKDELIFRAVEHRQADRLRQNYGYWQTRFYSALGHRVWKGCAIGCLATRVPTEVELAEVMDNTEAEELWRHLPDSDECRIILREEFGLPGVLVDAAESIFEHVSGRRSKTWPEDFARAIPIGIVIDRPAFEGLTRDSKFWIYDGWDGGQLWTKVNVKGFSYKKAADELLDWLRALEPKKNRTRRRQTARV